METPALIASDIDGTLLDPLEKLTDRTIAALAAVRAAGTPFVLVSGRPARWIPPVSSRADLDGYAVCANGAVLYDIGADRIVSVHGLDPILLHDVAGTLAHALPGSYLATERAEPGPHVAHGVYSAEPGFTSPWDESPDECVTRPRAEVLGHRAAKLLVRHAGMTSEEMRLAAVELLDGSVDVTFSSNQGLIELSAPGVTKATGLAEVADLAGVPRAAVVAFGDMPNDIEMLRWAGHGVAMGNAHDSVKAVADEIADANADDGVARVLERWFAPVSG